MSSERLGREIGRLLVFCFELAGGGLFVRGAMLLKPAIGFEFNRGHLGTREACTHKRRKRFAGFVATESGNDHPEVGASCILRNATAAEVNGAELRLRSNVSLFRRFRKP